MTIYTRAKDLDHHGDRLFTYVITNSELAGCATLNTIMELDHIIQVMPDGSVHPAPSTIWSPELHDEELDLPFKDGEKVPWELLTGYSGQHGYRGPVMHNSECVRGSIADRVLSEPGYYVAIEANWSCDDIEVPEDFPVRPLTDATVATAGAVAECGECHLRWDDAISTTYTPAPSARCPFEGFHVSDDNAEGWAVAYLPAEN